MEVWLIILSVLAWLGWGGMTVLVVGSLVVFALRWLDKKRRK